MIRCIVIEDEPLAMQRLVQDLKKIAFVRLLASFENAIEAISYLGDHEVDLVLSDIDMPGVSGVELLKALPKRPTFIFITGKDEYAVESYDLEVFDYIVKPYPFERLLKALTRVRLLLSPAAGRMAIQTGHFALKENSRNHLIPYEQIQYIEGEKEYIRVSTTEKEYVIVYSLKKILHDLPEEMFMRVHKSYIINKNYVKAVDPDKTIMKGSIKNIPIGVTYRDEIYRVFIHKA